MFSLLLSSEAKMFRNTDLEFYLCPEPCPELQLPRFRKSAEMLLRTLFLIQAVRSGATAEEHQFEEFVRLSGDGIVSRCYLFIHVLQVQQTKFCSSLPFRNFLYESTVTLGIGLFFNFLLRNQDSNL